MNFPDIEVEKVKLEDEIINKNNVELFLLREDKIHPEISGNKWRKLKYNVLAAKAKKLNSILTFGGAYSNHIAATAAAGREFGINTIGIIRGEEPKELNPTLKKAQDDGMLLHFISRELYKEKETEEFKAYLQHRFDGFHMVPEGGANYYGVNGCMEILSNSEHQFDIVALACGTGSTLAGVTLTLEEHQRVIGFPALKGGDFLMEDIRRLIYSVLINEEDTSESMEQVELKTDYHFGGYAKINDDLVDFMNWFKSEHGIQLDGIYTGKMMFGMYDLIKKGAFKKGTKILTIHTGGLQGNAGLMQRYGVKL